MADASHELRTPLTILHSAMDQLDARADLPLRIDSIEAIEDERKVFIGDAVAGVLDLEDTILPIVPVRVQQEVPGSAWRSHRLW